MAIVDFSIKGLVNKLKAEPEREEELVKIYSEYWKRDHRESQIGVIINILYNLYECEFTALKRDICKVLLMGASEVDSKNRYECLQKIFPHILNHFNGDISEILGALQELDYNDGDDYDVDDLPFT